MPTSHFLVALSTILILWFGGNMVLSGEITLGEMVAFNGYLLMIAEPARQMVWLVNSAGEAGAGLKRTFDVLDLQPEMKQFLVTAYGFGQTAAAFRAGGIPSGECSLSRG